MAKDKLEKEKLKQVLTCMFKGIEGAKDDLYQSLKKKIQVQTDDAELFYFSLIYPFSKLITGMIRAEVSKDKDIEFIYVHSQFVERFFQVMIQKQEGMTCCADKSRTIIRRLVAWFKDGEPIKFNYKQKYTYHLPRKIFKTHKDIIEFYSGIKSLYYGQPEKYMKAMLRIIKSSDGKK